MGKNENQVLNLPFAPHEFPGFRIGAALENKVSDQLCFVVGGGIGDRVCAEPTLRFALDNFKGVEVSLICETPELFSHLKFKQVFDLKKTYPIVGRHLYLNTYPKSPLFNQFVNANMVDLVDFASISALRCQLPFDKKCIRLEPQLPSRKRTDILCATKIPGHVLVHPGKSWNSRTFTPEFWSDVVKELIDAGMYPVLIGTNTVDVMFEEKKVLDLRNKTTLQEYMWICKNSFALITNDSSPLHLAAPGGAKIAYIATCRRGDLLLHERLGGKGWGMRDFAKDQMWKYFDMIPNHLQEGRISELPEGMKIDDFLPDAKEIVEWIR